MTWENIGGYSLTTVVIFCAGWLVKKWLESKIKADVDQKYKMEFAEFQKKLEIEKDAEIAKLDAELNQKTQTAIATLTSELNILEAQNSARFSRIFVKQADVIAEVYSRFLNLKEVAGEYTMPIQPQEEERTELLAKFNTELNAAVFFFTRNRIYVPKESATKVGNLLLALNRLIVQYSMAKAESKAQTRQPETYGRLFEQFFKTSDEIPSMLESLHDDFQKLLGIAKEEVPQPPPESSIDVVKILYGQSDKN